MRTPHRPIRDLLGRQRIRPVPTPRRRVHQYRHRWMAYLRSPNRPDDRLLGHRWMGTNPTPSRTVRSHHCRRRSLMRTTHRRLNHLLGPRQLQHSNHQHHHLQPISPSLRHAIETGSGRQSAGITHVCGSRSPWSVVFRASGLGGYCPPAVSPDPVLHRPLQTLFETAPRSSVRSMFGVSCRSRGR